MLAPMWRQPAARQNVMVLQKSARAHSARNAQISSGVEGREAVEQLLWFPQTCQECLAPVTCYWIFFSTREERVWNFRVSRCTELWHSSSG